MDTYDTLMQYRNQAVCPNGHMVTMMYEPARGDSYIPIAYQTQPHFIRFDAAPNGIQPCPFCGEQLPLPEGDTELA